MNRNLAKSLSGEKMVVVLQNNSKSGISNLSERYQIKADLSKYILEDRFYDGYRTIYGTVFICNNAEINKDFYIKQALGNNEAYISDYFVDIVIKLNDDYGDLIYTNYEDLLGQEVVYQNMAIFKIAGILKTDYKEYIDERGNQNENKITTFEDKKNYISTYEYKLNYEYNVIYTTLETFNRMYIGKNSSSYRQDEGYQICTTEADYRANLTNIHIYNSSVEDLQYFDNSGYLNTTKQGNSGEGVLFNELQDDEIVINGELYNCIFGSNINWEEFRMNYQYGIDSGNLLMDKLLNLGKTIDIAIKDSNGNTVIDILKKKIVGVNSINNKREQSVAKTVGVSKNYDFGKADDGPVDNTIHENIEHQDGLGQNEAYGLITNNAIHSINEHLNGIFVNGIDSMNEQKKIFWNNLNKLVND